MKAIIRAKEFERIINNTKKFTRAEGGARLMAYIHLHVDAEKQEIKATALDGHRLSVEYAKVEDADKSFSCLIKPVIPKINRYDSYAELEFDGKKAFVTVRGSITGHVQPKGEYFSTKEIIQDATETEPLTTICFNAAYLEDALEAAKVKEGSRTIVRIDIRGKNQPVIFRTENADVDKENIKLILPVHIRE